MSLTIKEGVTFSHLVTVTDADDNPVDLTHITLLSQVRARARTGAVIFTFTLTPVDLSQGKFRLELTDEQTAAASYYGVAVWDILITDSDGSARRTEEQKITIQRGVTRT